MKERCNCGDLDCYKCYPKWWHPKGSGRNKAEEEEDYNPLDHYDDMADEERDIRDGR